MVNFQLRFLRARKFNVELAKKMYETENDLDDFAQSLTGLLTARTGGKNSALTISYGISNTKRSHKYLSTTHNITTRRTRCASAQARI
jgi:hypothetical protein